MVKSAYTTDDIRKICGVTIQTVISWSNKGMLPAYKTLGGHRRVKKADLIEFLKKNKMPLSPELAKEWSFRILIVNDDKALVDLLAGLINKKYNHCETSSAIDEYEAGRQILSFKPDLVIVGLNLPGVDGFEICGKIKSDPETKHLKVLAITEDNPENIKEEILNCGADGYLSKPFDIKQISSYLNEFGVDSEVE